MIWGPPTGKSSRDFRESRKVPRVELKYTLQWSLKLCSKTWMMFCVTRSTKIQQLHRKSLWTIWLPGEFSHNCWFRALDLARSHYPINALLCLCIQTSWSPNTTQLKLCTCTPLIIKISLASFGLLLNTRLASVLNMGGGALVGACAFWFQKKKKNSWGLYVWAKGPLHMISPLVEHLESLDLPEA